MAIPTKSRGGAPIAVYRIIAMHVARAPLPTSRMQAIIAAMTADVTGQYEFQGATGNVLIYDFAPSGGTNPLGSLNLKNAITWEGVTFEVLSATKNRTVY